MEKLNTLRGNALKIYHAGLQAVESDTCVREHINLNGNILKIGVREYDLDTYEDIYIVGFGKVSGYMAAELEELFAERINAGVVNVRYGYEVPCKLVKINSAGHPIPDSLGIEGTKEIERLLKNVKEKDLVFCLISGGGSALFVLPYEGITLEEIQSVTGLLLRCGATIDEINAIRKHLSMVKGGRMARMCKGEIISLILSDVVNDPLDTIASGPTSPDNSSFLDCQEVFAKYDLLGKIPASIKTHIEDGIKGRIEETPSVNDNIFDKVNNVIIGNNRIALESARKKAEELGYQTLILSSYIQGEAKEVAKLFGAIAKEIDHSGNPLKRPACIIAGGETTVLVKGEGLGGRNQELALVAALEIEGMENTVILSVGSDGTDGNTDAAGAIVDGQTVVNARRQEINTKAYLAENDSYTYFKKLNSLITTGPTKTNVMDVMLLLVG